MKTKITNVKTLGKYLNSAEELVGCEILIEDKKITAFSESINESADELIDGAGKLILPGLIDPQVHFREPGQEYKEDIESGSLAAARGGFTTVVCMPNTSPSSDSPEVIKHIVNRSNEVGIARVLPTGCVSMGLKGNEYAPYEDLKAAGVVAMTDDGKGIQSDEFMTEAMTRIGKLNLPILDHSEDESLSNSGSIHAGAVSEKFGVKGILSSSESVHVKRGCELAESTDCHFHVLHISTQESINYVRAAKAKGIKVTAEVSPHHLLLCDEDIPEREPGNLHPNWKMNPPLRSKIDMMECRKALNDGTIDMIATDHAPHAEHEKAKPIEEAPFGIIGLETSFPLVYTNFVKNGDMKLGKLADMMTVEPAKLFHLPYGQIKIDALADLTIIDIENEKTVTDDFFFSKSKNSPFVGYKLTGFPVMTMFEGKVVFSEL